MFFRKDIFVIWWQKSKFWKKFDCFGRNNYLFFLFGGQYSNQWLGLPTSKITRTTVGSSMQVDGRHTLVFGGKNPHRELSKERKRDRENQGRLRFRLVGKISFGIFE